MKAFLLAAGKGTRLQPLTFHTPKCLIPICHKPLIEYWFDLFECYEIDEILINTSHLAEKVEHYIWKNARDLKITIVYEDTLLGSGGTIKRNRDFIEKEETFLICYADNLTDINLNKMIHFHNSRNKEFTLALVKVPNPGECGIVEMGEDLTVHSFIEKPAAPVTDLAFAGIMLSSPNLLAYFPDRDVFDLGHDVLPHIAGVASGYVMNEYLIDIGTPEKLNQAERDLKNGKIKFSR